MNEIGQSRRRIEDGPLLRGQTRFIDDIAFPNQLHMRVVRSPVAYGRIVGVDTRAAAALPGVVAIWTADDVANVNPIPFRQIHLEGMERFHQYALARGYVRYVGDPLAVVFAEDPYLAEDAAACLVAEIEELTPCLSATDPDAEFTPGVPAEAGVIEKGYGDLKAAFAAAERVVSLDLEAGRHGAVPMEPRGLIGVHETESDTLRLYGAAKIPHRNRLLLSEILDHPAERLHLHEGHVGGGFGARGEIYPEDLLVLVAAKRLGRPVKWIEDRRENLMATNHSRQQTHAIRAAIDGRGYILGLDAEFWLDQGGYVRSHGGAVTDLTSAMLPGPYVVPAYRCVGHIRLTNKTPCGTYRAPGRYEGSFVRERLIDAIARELDLDPIAVRRVNLIPESALPFDRKLTALTTHVTYDSARFENLLDRLLAEVDHDALKQDVASRRAAGECVGLGLAYFVEKSGLGPVETARFILEPDGGVEIVTGAASVGQGFETVMAQIAAEASGVPFENFRVTHGQTNRIPHGLGASASRATTMSGSAVFNAGHEFAETLRDAAAGVLQRPAAELILRDGWVGTAEAEGPSITLTELAQEKGALEAEGSHESRHMVYPYGIHLVVARVDRETGGVTLERLVIAYDIGKAVNPMLIRGQFAGGAAQGIGGALLEEFVYDEAGQPLAATFADYRMATAGEVPPIELLLREDAPSPLNPLGVKGAGEGGLTGLGAAIASAVDDAIQGKGAIDRLPITPVRLKAILDGLET